MKDIYKQTGIYRITNVLNGMTYVGQTRMNFGDRWDSHRAMLRSGKHGNPFLQREWDTYGEDNFEFAVIHYEEDMDNLDPLEQEYIASYRDLGLCLNILDGGKTYPNQGKHLSEDTKRKIGEKNRAHMTGRKASETTKQRMSESQKARFEKMTDDERAAYGKVMSERTTGSRWSAEARAAFSERQRMNPNSASKFTAEKVLSVRQKAASGVPLEQLANEFNTTKAYIKSIVDRRRWARI